jgi:CRISPR-associated protein Csx3
MAPVKVILGGPPRSGKSVLREALKRAILAVPGAPYPYVITACPDGEGAWYQETVRNHPELAARLKAEYKAKFTREFAERVAESVRRCELPLTVIDLGGVVDEKNESIARHASHAILIGAQDQDLRVWRDFCEHLSLRLVAELRSDYNAIEDRIGEVDFKNVLRGTVHHLERGEDASGRPLIRELARHLAKQAVYEMDTRRIVSPLEGLR